MLAAADGERFKNVNQQIEATSFQKNLAAANIDPSSPEGLAMARMYVTNQADPLVEMETPTGEKFVGPRSEYFKKYGDVTPAKGRPIVSPKSKDEYDALPAGAQYRAPDGSLKIKGGAKLSASANFSGGSR